MDYDDLVSRIPSLSTALDYDRIVQDIPYVRTPDVVQQGRSSLETVRYWAVQALPHVDWSQTTQSVVQSLIWPAEVTFEMKGRYIGETTLANNTCYPEICRYFLTFEYLASHPKYLLRASEYIFGCDDIVRRKNVVHMSLDLANIFNLRPGARAESSFAYMTPLELTSRIRSAMKMVHRLYILCCKASAVAESAITGEVRSVADDEDVPMADDVDDAGSDELLPHQQLLEALLLKAEADGLRRKANMLYKPKITEEGFHTRFYEEGSEIIDYVYESFPAKTDVHHYNILTSRQTYPKHVETLVEKVHGVNVPFMQPSRHLFAFSNGLFDIKQKKFYVHDNVVRPTTHFVHSVNELPPNVCAANYFPVEMHIDLVLEPPVVVSLPDAPADICALQASVDNQRLNDDRLHVWQGSSIQTPVFDKILRDQNFGKKDIQWCMIMMSRALFDVGEMDGWETIFFLRGVAGSGKSTLLKLLAEFYPAHEIGSIMSDGQSTFFDEHLIDKLMVIAMDADSSTTWSRTRFNSYASGETITINRKNKLAVSKRWSAHLFMASNCFPSFPDEGGNVARRFVMFLFEICVKSTDSRLFEKLKAELPLIMLKCVLSYHEAVRDFGKHGLWDKRADGTFVLPDMCIRAKREFLSHTSPFAALFESGRVVLSTDQSMSVASLRSEISAFIRERNAEGGLKMKVPAVDKVRYGALFLAHGIRFVQEVDATGQVVDMLVGIGTVDRGVPPAAGHYFSQAHAASFSTS